MMKLGIIYLATAPSGKRYVGKTVQTLADRIWEHKNTPKCPLIHAAIAKYGDAMQWRVLAVVGEEFLADAERMYIAELQPEYNCTAGGDGGSPNAYARAKMSASKKGKTLSPAHRAAISAGLQGHIVAPQTRARISAGRKGKSKPLSPAHKAAISAGLMGNKNARRAN